MDEGRVDKLGLTGFSRSVNPMRRERFKDIPFLGFDTEYAGGGKDLLSFQLAGARGSRFVPLARGRGLRLPELWKAAVSLLEEEPEEILLIAYFSPAELQFFDVAGNGFNVREYSRGSLDASFMVKPGRCLTVFDLARWYDGQSLAKAAESIGLDKLPWNRRKITRATLRVPGFARYAVNDAELAYRLFDSLRAEFKVKAGVDMLGALTPASASAQAFRRLHVKRKLFCDCNAARRAALLGTWGGRAEVFERGDLGEGFAEYDIKSAYPRSAVALCQLPIQGSWRSARKLSDLDRARGGFVHILFDFPAGERFPCIPVWTGTLLLYPLSGRAWCTVEEARAALEAGARLRLLEGWTYRTGSGALADFMERALEERGKAKGAAKTLWKLLSNSLIGKFAQAISRVPLGEYWRLAEEGGFLLDELFELTPDELQALGARQVVSVGPVFMPEWNGLITGFTRATLSRMLRAARRPVYCHTDSIWAKGLAGTFALPYEIKERGAVKVVRTRFGSLGSHIAHHSVWNLRAAAQMLKRFDGSDFLRKYPIVRPLRVREALRHGLRPCVWVKEWRAANCKWDFKRKLLPDGSTRPWKDIEEFSLDR